MTADRLAARELLASFLGPALPSVPLEVAVSETVDCGAYVRRRMSYDVAPDVRVSAYLCVPAGLHGPAPAVFCHHQHAGDFALGKSEAVGLRGDADLAYAAELATEGFVTLAPDAIGFEDRNWSPDGAGNVTWFELSRRLVEGRTLLADCLREVSVGLDLLTTLPEVDPDRLGFIGHSYGGRMALFALAYDERIRASVSNCQCIPYRSTFTPDTGLQAEFVLPGFAARHDLEDLFPAYSAETALLISVGTSDRWSRGHTEIFAAAERALGDRAELAAYDVGHTFTRPMRRAAYDFLTRRLA